MDRKKKLFLRGVVVTIVSVAVGTALFMLPHNGFNDRFIGEFNYSLIKDYSYKDSSQSGSENDQAGNIVNWNRPVSGDNYGTITCEVKGLNAPLYYGDSDDILLKGAGQSELSYCPGEGKDIVVGGHDTTFFAPLKNIVKDDVITISAKYGVFTYKVDQVNIIDGSDFNIESSAERLILYTCYPFGENNVARTQKAVYVCSKLSGPVIGGGND